MWVYHIVWDGVLGLTVGGNTRQWMACAGTVGDMDNVLIVIMDSDSRFLLGPKRKEFEWIRVAKYEVEDKKRSLRQSRQILWADI